MAEFDFDLFIDNVLKNKSNAELLQIERAPAAQREKQVVIQDSAKVSPIEYPAGYKPQVPQSEIIRQNVNPVIEAQQQSAKDLGANLKDIYGEYSGYKGGMQDALKNLQTVSQRRFEDPELDEKITAAQADYSGIKDVPERDLLTEAILSFGPAVFGALGGESAQISQLPAGQKAREMYEGRRKEDIERVKQLREQADKRYKTLVEMKKTQQESFDKSQQREMDRLKAVLSGSGDLAKMSGDELKTTEQRLLDLQKDIAKGTIEGTTEVAKMERSAELEENKRQRAKIIAEGKDLKMASDLRKEFTARPDVKNFADVRSSYEKIKEVAKKPSAAGDISMIFSYMKMLDPGSVVREGEQASAQNAAGVPDRVRNLYNNLITGERLNPKQRKDFMDRAEDLYSAQQRIVSGIEKEYKTYATEYGIRPDLVIGAPSQAIQPKYKDGDTRKIGAKTYVRKGGKWQEKN